MNILQARAQTLRLREGKSNFALHFLKKNHSFTTSSKLNPLYCTEKIEAGENRV